MQTIELNVQGMTCGGCVKHVTKALQSVPGVNQVSVDLASGRARVDSDLPLGAKSLIAALAKEDYPASVALGTGSSGTKKEGASCHGTNTGKGGCCCH